MARKPRASRWKSLRAALVSIRDGEPEGRNRGRQLATDNSSYRAMLLQRGAGEPRQPPLGSELSGMQVTRHAVNSRPFRPGSLSCRPRECPSFLGNSSLAKSISC
jgi:hypothetical protein